MKLPGWLAQMLTEDDANSVICPVRVIGASGAITLVGNSVYMAVAHGAFDPMNFGAGVAAIAGAVGLGVGAKAKMGG